MYDEKTLAQKIPLDKMIIGGAYRIEARNSSFGIWNGKGFNIKRVKFNDVFIDEELHYDSDERYGTAVPLEYIEQTDFDLNLTQHMLNYLIEVEKRN